MVGGRVGGRKDGREEGRKERQRSGMVGGDKKRVSITCTHLYALHRYGTVSIRYTRKGSARIQYSALGRNRTVIAVHALSPYISPSQSTTSTVPSVYISCAQFMREGEHSRVHEVGAITRPSLPPGQMVSVTKPSMIALHLVDRFSC